MAKEFVHTHVHSDYSLLDASISVENLANDAAKLGMKAMALTDHGNIMGHVSFFQACKKAGIKPILGCELYVARRNATEKMDKFGGNPTDHLVVMAENEEGYKNLIELVSWANKYGFHYTPRVDLSVLAKHSKGLIAQTACLSGGVNRLLTGWEARNPETNTWEAIPGSYKDAQSLACSLRDIFGPDNFFLEIQHHAGQYQDDDLVKRQRSLIDQVLRLHKDTGIPLIGTNDIHFRTAQDARAREIALMIARGAKASSKEKMDLIAHAGEFYVKSPDQMDEVFKGYDIALKNTILVAERCNVTLDLGKHKFPRPMDENGELTDQQIQERWDYLLRRGFQERYSPDNTKAWERLAYEKGVIEKVGFVPYFLIVSDFVMWAKKNGIPVGPLRGSVGGSIVAYVLHITEVVDPLKYDLLFERFLNPERVSMPDIDIDFCRERAPEVINYLVRKYGKDRVAKISTIGALWARGVVREVGKILDLPMDEVDQLAKSIPQGGGEFQVSVADAFGNGDPDLAVPELKKLKDSDDPRHRELVEICTRLEGIKRSVGTHACGLIIGDKPIKEYAPLIPIEDSEIYQIGAEMTALDSLGLLKMDVLFLDALTVLDHTAKLVEKRTGEKIDYLKISLEDSSVYDYICAGRTIGMFQLETDVMRPIVVRIQPRNIEDIAAIVALNRPGPLDYIDEEGYNMVERYIRRRNNVDPVSYMHPKMEPILKNTLGIMTYQEQIMRIASELAGYTMSQADNLRKGIGKKLPEVIAKEREKFIPAAVQHSGMSLELATQIWETIEKFARYGFNKPHAVGYAVIAYWTAWAKFYYPVEFMAARLSSAVGAVSAEYTNQVEADTKDNDSIAAYIYECNKLGVKVLEPDINKSEEQCIPEGNAIRAGFRIVKDVGSNGQIIVAARRAGGAFVSFDDFLGRVIPLGATMSSIIPLIKAGCIPFGDRNFLLAIVERSIARLKARLKRQQEDEERAQRGEPPKKRKVTKVIQEDEFEWEPMPPEQIRAETLAAIGVYSIPDPIPRGLYISCRGKENIEGVSRLVAAHPGKIKTYLRGLVGNKWLTFELPGTSGSDEFIREVSKLGRVKED